MAIYETSKYGEISSTRYANGNYFVENGRANLKLEISEEEFLKAVDDPPLEIKDEDLLIGLTKSLAQNPNEKVPGSYFTFHIKPDESIKSGEYIKYKTYLYKVDFIENSQAFEGSIRIYCS